MSRRVSGWMLVLTFLLPLLISSHSLSYVDPDCDPGFLNPGHADARVDAGSQLPTGNHCVVCHWLRTAASASPGLAPAPVPAPTSGPTTVSLPLLARRETPRSNLAPRAPPRSTPL